MKLKEKLANESYEAWVDSSDCYYSTDELNSRQYDSEAIAMFIAGFEKCREMAKEIAGDYAHQSLCPPAKGSIKDCDFFCDAVHKIGSMGEDEVEVNPYTSLKPLGQIYRDAKMKPWRDMTTRERDVLIAEKVIGVSAMLNQHLDCPHYSTDIKAAWEVLDKFVHYSVDKQNNQKFIVVLPKDNSLSNGGEHESAQGDTAPEAICLAALKAIGVDV